MNWKLRYAKQFSLITGQNVTQFTFKEVTKSTMNLLTVSHSELS